MNNLIIHPQFVKVVKNGKTIARANKLATGNWSTRPAGSSQYTEMTPETMMQVMTAQAISAACTG